MSQQNPTIPTATQAKGIDAAVNDLQTALSFDLSWLTNGMGRAYRRNKTRSNGASAFLPMVYLGTNFAQDFFNATPDNDKEGQSIILVGDATHTDFKTGFYGWLEYPISIIFSANLKTIDSALLATEDFTEHLMEDVRDSIRNLLGKSYRVSIDSETREFETVYSEFDIGVGTTNKPLLPMTYFRFECTLTVKEDCGNNVLDRCTAILQNLTSDDLLNCILPTYDFSDTTVQAAVTAQQQTDLTDWLCTSGPAEYTFTFDGLNEELTVPNNAAFDFVNTDPFTIEAWIRPTSYINNAGILGWYVNSGNFNGLQIRQSLNKFSFWFRKDASNWIEVRTAANIPLNAWSHYILKYDGSSNANNIEIWHNDILVAKTIVNNTLNTASTPMGLDLSIGKPSTVYWQGGIGNTRIWNKVLSTAETTSQFNSGRMLGTPVALGNLVFGNKSAIPTDFNGTNFVYTDETTTNTITSVNMDLSNLIEY